MGLDLLDFIWDFLKQSFLFVLAAAVFFLAVANNASNTGFFMQYSAKDTGLVMETLHAARGNVELSYSKLLPQPAFNYKFEAQDVLLQPNDTTKPDYWPVRKRYAMDSVLSVANSTLLAPASIVFEKQGTALRAATASSPPMGCQAPADKPLRLSTNLTLTGNSPLLTPQLRQLERQYAPSAAPATFIAVTIDKDPSLKAIVVESSGDALGQALGCLLSQGLAASLPTASIQLLRAPASQDSHAALRITHPDVAGLDDAKLNQALQLALGGVLR